MQRRPFRDRRPKRSQQETLEEFEVVPDPESAAALQAFQQEHATEIAAEEGKPFELVKDEEPADGLDGRRGRKCWRVESNCCCDNQSGGTRLPRAAVPS